MLKKLEFIAHERSGDTLAHWDAPCDGGAFYRIRLLNSGKYEVRLCYGLDGNGVSPVRSVFLKLCGKLSAAQSFANRHYKEQLRNAALRAAQEVIAARPSNSYGGNIAAVRLPYKDN